MGDMMATCDAQDVLFFVSFPRWALALRRRCDARDDDGGARYCQKEVNGALITTSRQMALVEMLQVLQSLRIKF
jgi:hypothetical protein